MYLILIDECDRHWVEFDTLEEARLAKQDMSAYRDESTLTIVHATIVE